MNGWAGAVLVLIFGAAAESCPNVDGQDRHVRHHAVFSGGDGLTTTRLDCELGAAELLPGISRPRVWQGRDTNPLRDS